MINPIQSRVVFLLITLSLFLVIPASATVSPHFIGSCLTGGTDGCLDSIDGQDLWDGWLATIITASDVYFYSLDIDSGAAESSPNTISPDTNAGDKRWILRAQTGGTGTGDMLKSVYDSDGDNYIDINNGGFDDDFSSSTGIPVIISAAWTILNNSSDSIYFWDNTDSEPQMLTPDADDFSIASDTLSLVAQIPHTDVNETITGKWNFTTILSDSLTIKNAGDSETLATFVNNGAVALYYNNNDIVTTANEGPLFAEGGAGSGDLYWISNSTLVLRNLVNSGDIRLAAKDSGGSTQVILTGDPDGETGIYHDGSKKFDTDSDGTTTTGRSKSTLGWADADAYGGLNAAVTALGSTAVTLVISSTQTLTASIDLTDSESIQLVIVPGGSITFGAYDLTIGHDDSDATNWSTLSAGPFEWVNYNSTGRLKLEEGACEHALAEWFGANSRDTNGDSTAIQAAIEAAEYGVKSVKFLAGTYYRDDSDQIVITATGFELFGAGRENTKLYCSAQPTGNGVIELSSNEPSSYLHDFTIDFNQTDTATKGSLALTKPAIYADAEPRIKISRLRIQRAYDGIDLSTGNSGGTTIDDLEMSALNVGISIDGALDTIKINKFHFYPFALTANQQSIFYSDTTAIFADRVDGLMINDFFAINEPYAILFSQLGGAASTVTKAIINNAWLDGNTIKISIPLTYLISNSHFHVNSSGINSIYATEGTVLISNCYFEALGSDDSGSADTEIVHFIESGSDYDRFISVKGSWFDTRDVDVKSIYLQESGTAIINAEIIGNHFRRTPDKGMSVTTIACSGNVRGSISNNLGRDLGSGTPNTYKFIELDTDDYISIVGNIGIGAAITVADTAAGASIRYSSNNPAASE